ISTLRSIISWRESWRSTLTRRTRDFPYWFSARMADMRSATSIGRVTEFTEQHGHVIMLVRVVHAKTQHHLGEKCRPGGGVKAQSVQARLQYMIFLKEIPDTSISVRAPFGQQFPHVRRHAVLQRHRNAGSRLAGDGIEDVRGDGAHSLSSFFSLSRVIWRCSSAALRTSSSG